MFFSRFSPPAVALLVVSTVLLVGCGSGEAKRYRVTGTVKYKGEPVKNGTISFRSLDGTQTGTGTIVSGEYDIPEASGLPVGKYQVSVSYPDPNGPPPPGPNEMPGDSTAVAKDLLPPKYNEKSELTAEVEAKDRNEVSFDLK